MVLYKTTKEHPRARGLQTFVFGIFGSSGIGNAFKGYSGRHRFSTLRIEFYTVVIRPAKLDV